MQKKLWLSILILTLIGVPNLKTIQSTAWYQKVFPSSPQLQPEPVVEPLAVLNPKLKPVCGCESNYSPLKEPRQFNDDGSVVLGKINPLDTGMCQINQKYHLATATKMGLDIFTEQGNIKYSNWLFENEGYTPWNWSKSCWGNYVDKPVSK